jgi:hypothetical protein
MKGINRKKT